MRIIENAAFERETTINFSDAEPGTIHVWTSQRRIGAWIEKLAKRLGLTFTKTGRPTWEVELPSAVLSLRQNVRKPMSDDQRAKSSERMKAMRQAQLAKDGAK